MKNKHLIVISVDALVFEDLAYAKTLKNFPKLLEEGAVIEKVKTIYPSLTHPVHATMITGAPAGKTGIINNLHLTPFETIHPWYNLLSEIKCETIFHAAKEAGLTTSACTWPVTAGGGDVIDYLVPGILNFYLEGCNGIDDVLEIYRKYGAPECLINIIKEGIEKYGYIDRHPEIDQFQIFCASKIIKEYKPNLMMIHPGYVDHARHRTGLFTEAVNESVKATDEWIGEILDAVREAGIEDSTDIVILSDHGQLGIVRILSPNVLLAREGFIRLDDKGELVDYDAIAWSGGLSAHVFLSRPDDKKLYDDVYSKLKKWEEEGVYGFERVLTKEECEAEYGLTGEFSFVLETDGYTSFSSDCTPPIAKGFDIEDYRFGKATHGHMPEKGPQPPFIGCGPSFKKGVRIERGDILNHAPTFAKILGIELKDAVGSAVEEILN